MPLTKREKSQLKAELRQSVKLLSTLNLNSGAKWSAEALNGLYDSDDENDEEEEEDQAVSNYKFQRMGAKENDRILLANTYFQTKEFQRCSTILTNSNSNSIPSIFIKLYSLFINGEKKKEEESQGVLGSHDNQNQANTHFPLILKELEGVLKHDNVEDPFLYYLYGVVLMKQKSIKLGQEALINSIKLYPFNWSAWQELISSIQTLDSSFKIIESLNDYFVSNFHICENLIFKIFKIVLNQEFFQQNDELYQELDALLKIFPNFSFLKTQKALMSYHALEYQDSEKLFDDILVNDPLRLDDLHIYSNILYVMEKKSKLAYLSQLACSVDRFRPETCCIIANYYSLKFEHEKAIMYYRRALTLNRNCLSAWTLMGHEFVELKNSHAAIESYRRAVDSNNKDFKAWYGLGQAYEVLEMHLYSLYYYQKACSLKPLDKRIWTALGHCYEKLGKIKDSIKSYQKALQLTEVSDVSIYYKLALLYEKLLDITKVYEFMKLCYVEELNEGTKNDETSKARLWLAKFEIDQKNWQLAYQYASDLNYGTSQEIEEARAIAREARNRLNLK